MALVKYNNNSISAITSTGLTAGVMTLIKEQTASSSATISFVHGTSDVVLYSTYPIYLFKFINIHPETNEVVLTMNGSADTGSNYNVTKTTTYFESWHNEGDSSTGLSYSTSRDMAQGTGFCDLQSEYGTDNDQAGCGEMYLFSPSSTTFVKHFMFTGNQYHQSDYSQNNYVAGYFNDTNDIDAIQFKMSSGNIDAGTFKLYGIKDS